MRLYIEVVSLSYQLRVISLRVLVLTDAMRLEDRPHGDSVASQVTQQQAIAGRGDMLGGAR